MIKIKLLILYIIILVIIISIIIIIIKIITKEGLENAKKGISYHQINNPEWYQALEFPEKEFLPNDDNYFNKVKMGYDIMKNKTIIISGLARDIAKNIYLNIIRMELLGNKFKDYRILIFENDSTDGTRQIIHHNSIRNNKIILINCPENPDCKLQLLSAVHEGVKSYDRFEKMANFRNRILNEVRSSFKNFDYLMVLDWDLTGPVSSDGIANCFYYSNWDVMAANGIVGNLLNKKGEKLNYYDSIAYVPKNKEPCNLTYIGLCLYTMKTWKLKFNRGDPPILVNSAFSGCALYKISSILNPQIKYTGEHCEHVTFHASMRNAGYDKIFINPSLIALHTISLTNSGKKIFEKFIFF